MVAGGAVYVSAFEKGGTTIGFDVATGADHLRVIESEIPTNGIPEGVPAVTPESVFVPYSNPSDEPSDVRAYETGDGTSQWLYETGAGAVSAITLTDGSILVADENARVHAVDRDSGKLAWRYKPGYPTTGIAGIAVRDQVYVATRGSESDVPDTGAVFALDPPAQGTSWSVRFESPVHNIAVSDDAVLVTADETITALQPKDGSELWSHSFDPEGEKTLAMGEEILIAGTSEEMVGFSVSDGAKQWNVERSQTAQLAIGNGIIYATKRVGEEIGLSAHVLRTGEQVWSTGVDEAQYTPPVIANGKVFVGREEDSPSDPTVEVLAWG